MPATFPAAVTPAHSYPPDVQVIHLDGREIFLVGTAHISRHSVDLVRQVIANEAPDCVCIELDEKRYESLSQRKRWVTLNIKEIIYKKQLATLLVNLILASYQKKLGEQLGVLPGTELLEAARAAEEQGVAIALCDRDVRITMRRAWHATGFWKKGYLMATLMASLFETTELTEEKLTELRSTDVLSELMEELGAAMPQLKRVLIDERDTFLAEKIKAATGQRLVAVVGAGHVTGIKAALTEDRSARMAEISTIPPVSPVWKIIGWAIPICIILAITATAVHKGSALASASIYYWILANGIPSALGALLALAHPITIITAFVAAPITSLTPVIGAGYVTAFVQAMLQPPLVGEFESVLTDILTVRGWWRNRLLKVFLAFLLPGFGSMIGSVLGGYRIFSNLF
ncbi:MAG: conjugal transfer protein TraB [Deltaproteobacteria bacterium CG23_combo_of_CG06-09_8_20_14_all_60_8]|nr:MAG: conjugal transfer protein TraB [Desulfobacterales bacterium CG2_30_60_27]PIP43978.1 MAG: conjugal transfer protein TraB [Deltaproteobacteria bacterium CG23_combo_of_CG06-09_8_20_14_all_60_8]